MMVMGAEIIVIALKQNFAILHHHIAVNAFLAHRLAQAQIAPLILIGEILNIIFRAGFQIIYASPRGMISAGKVDILRKCQRTLSGSRQPL